VSEAGFKESIKSTASVNGFFDRLDNKILVGFGQKRMHGKAQDFPRGLFGFRKVAPFVAEFAEHWLLVEAFGVIDGGRYAGGFQLFGNNVAVGNEDSILSINMSIPGQNRRSPELRRK
jgi:hypothetical protein